MLYQNKLFWKTITVLSALALLLPILVYSQTTESFIKKTVAIIDSTGIYSTNLNSCPDCTIGIIYTENNTLQKKDSNLHAANYPTIPGECSYDNYDGTTDCTATTTKVSVSADGWHQKRWQYRDCTTGQILDEGRIKYSSETPWKTPPLNHTGEFILEQYQCYKPDDKLPQMNSINCSYRNMTTNFTKYCNENNIWSKKTKFEYTPNNDTCILNKATDTENQLNTTCPTNSACDTQTTTCKNTENNGGSCNAGWKCKNDFTKAYQNNDCSWNQETNCTTWNKTIGNEIYCSGKDWRKKEKIQEYSCINAECTANKTSTSNDTLIKTCANNCINNQCTAECSGTITIYATNQFLQKLSQIQIFKNSQRIGETNNQGKLTIPITTNECNKNITITTATIDGYPCSTTTTKINKTQNNNDIYIKCTNTAKKINNNTTFNKSSYKIGEEITLTINTTDSTNNPINETTITITNQQNNTKTNLKTNSTGTVLYKTIAQKSGPNAFTINTSKNGYQETTKTVKVTVNELKSIQIIVWNNQGTPVENAKIYLDNKLTGTTNTEGKFSLKTDSGIHLIEAKNAFGTTCDSKTVDFYNLNGLSFTCQTVNDFTVEVTDSYNNGILNAIVLMDNKFEGLTSSNTACNSFACLQLNNVQYGIHSIQVLINTDSNCGEQKTIQATKTFNVNELNKKALIEVDLTNPNNYIESKAVVSSLDKKITTKSWWIEVAAEIVPQIAMSLYEIAAQFVEPVGGMVLTQFISEGAKKCNNGNAEGCFEVVATFGAPIAAAKVSEVCSVAINKIATEMKPLFSGIEKYSITKLATPIIIEGTEYSMIQTKTGTIILQRTIGNTTETAITMSDYLIPELQQLIQKEGNQILTSQAGKNQLVDLIRSPNTKANGINGIAPFRAGEETWGANHTYLKHFLGYENLIETGKPTSFFPIGQRITIQGKTVLLPKAMQATDLPILIKETMQAVPLPDKDKLVFTKSGDFIIKGISKVKVIWNNQFESITTVYPEEGVNIVRWNNEIKTFEIFNGTNWIEYTYNG